MFAERRNLGFLTCVCVRDGVCLKEASSQPAEWITAELPIQFIWSGDWIRRQTKD